ncbi:MAG: hypothetical protein ABJE47_19395 [bacterium]
MILIAVVALATALATWFGGWWGVAVVALVAGFLASEHPSTPWRVALGALLGWIVLLVVDAGIGPFARLATALGGAMSIPAPALLLMTVLFAALLAWSAATVAAEIGRLKP